MKVLAGLFATLSLFAGLAHAQVAQFIDMADVVLDGSRQRSVYGPSVAVSAMSGNGSVVGVTVYWDTSLDDCASLACVQTGFVVGLADGRIAAPELPASEQRPYGVSLLPVGVDALSFDGSVAALGYSEDYDFQAGGVILRDGRLEPLPFRSESGDWLEVTSMSSDGTVVAGLVEYGGYYEPADNDGSSGFRPFIWSADSGTRDIVGVAGDTSWLPIAVSGDGGAVVFNDRDSLFGYGQERENAFVLYDDGMRIELSPVGDGTFSEAMAVSHDGGLVTGVSREAADGSTLATIWRDGDGFALGTPSGYSSQAWDMTSTGSSVVGSLSQEGTWSIALTNHRDEWPWYQFDQAVLWRGGEAHLLEDLLANEYGLGDELEGWSLTSATAISDDGTVIAGQGIDPDGNQSAWVAVLSVPEPSSLFIFVGLFGLGLVSGRR